MILLTALPSTRVCMSSKHQIDKLLEEYEVPQVVKDYFPCGWHHFDSEGRPLCVLRLG
ncbi:unnamed protein product [Trichogramma brassicae]|uniref:Uncharacterized protein n=1 Tax=Trichogramma brassicae TaxID=86971 RepID=A0A6H5ITB9_9HYME|nr:unnamed protein product [Trichogramma brassicae]